MSHPAGRWTLEGSAGAWLYADNADFFGGQRLEQNPLGVFQAHAIYTFRRGLWLSGSATFYTGGRTSLNGVEQNTFQENTRFGFTLSLPTQPGQSLKLIWARGVATRRGSDFTTLGVAWQRVWF